MVAFLNIEIKEIKQNSVKTVCRKRISFKLYYSMRKFINKICKPIDCVLT